MALNVVRFAHRDRAQWGVVSEGQITTIPGEFATTADFVRSNSVESLAGLRGQFYKGKSYRTFGPVGPYLCLLAHADWSYLRSLQLSLTVNGELRQHASTAELVCRPEETLTELSGMQDLLAGDLLATGTPAGCALRVPPAPVQKLGALLSDRTRFRIFVHGQKRRGRYLQPGDVVESRIRSLDGVIDLGVQRNVVVDQPRARPRLTPEAQAETA